MPPKISKKNETKKKAASLDDKTFGLKNKKGAKQQQVKNSLETINIWTILI